MNKLNTIALIIFTAAICACNQKSNSNTANRTQTSTAESPTMKTSNEVTIPNSKSGDFDAGVKHFDSKNYEKAIAEFETVGKSDAKNHLAQFYLGKSYQAVNKADEAISAYKKAVEINPDYAEANFELGKIYRGKKDYAASLPYLQKAARIKDSSTEYLMALGDNYRELKKCDYAVVPYGTVTRLDEKNAAAFYGMGLCYIELKNGIAAGQQVRYLEKLDKNLAKKLSDQIPK